MSHFTVLIVGKNVEEQLAPFQENNMGDCPEEYLEFHDIEDEYLKDYHEDTSDYVVMEDGSFVSRYDDCFKVKTDTFSSEIIIPDHLKIVAKPISEIYPTFEQYMADCCGYKERNPETNRYGYYENPRAKWDWYAIGGRWAGFFRLKRLRELLTESKILESSNFSESEFINLIEIYVENIKQFTENTLHYKDSIKQKLIEDIMNFLNLISLANAPNDFDVKNMYESYAFSDQTQKKNIDFEFMRNQAGEKAGKNWDEVHIIIKDDFKTFRTWNQIREIEFQNKDIDGARFAYHEQEAVKKFKTLKQEYIFSRVEDYNMPRNIYIQNAKDNSISTFAIIKDGEWYEKGDMGWWGCVSNEKDQNMWNQEFLKMLNELPDDTLLTIVDCHI